MEMGWVGGELGNGDGMGRGGLGNGDGMGRGWVR